MEAIEFFLLLVFRTFFSVQFLHISLLVALMSR